MKIRYLGFSPKIASARLRNYIPASILAKRGHEIVFKGPADVVILGKHDFPEDAAHNAGHVVFDVCDDHFDHPELGEHYRRWVGQADTVTCNSRVMRDRIAALGRIAVVIDDPYESPEHPAKCHAPALWFGHKSNLVDLIPILDRLPETVVVSNVEGAIQWSPESMKQAWQTCGIAVIPTGKSMAKSANRAIEAIRHGLYPCCGRLPAYDEIGLGTEDVPRETWERLKGPNQTIELVRALQANVRERFSPETVADAWEKVIARGH